MEAQNLDEKAKEIAESLKGMSISDAKMVLDIAKVWVETKSVVS